MLTAGGGMTQPSVESDNLLWNLMATAEPSSGDGDISMKIWGRLPPGAVLSAFLIAGMALIFSPHYWQWEWDYGIASEIGVALLVAAILGFTVDRWLKAELRTDAFLAAIGHVLAPEFRAEVSRIIGYKLICERHYLLVEVALVSDRLVKVTSSVERTIRNKSAYPQTIKNLMHIDEWGYAAGQSQVIECVLEIDGQTFDAGPAQIDAYSVLRQTEEKTLRPNQTAKLRARSVEYRNINDIVYFHFMAPTINPEIEVRVPPELDCNFGFGGPGENIVTLAYAPRKQLEGTYFPHQSMSVRWWPKLLKG